MVAHLLLSLFQLFSYIYGLPINILPQRKSKKKRRQSSERKKEGKMKLTAIEIAAKNEYVVMPTILCGTLERGRKSFKMDNKS